jgi:hypothetical protein
LAGSLTIGSVPLGELLPNRDHFLEYGVYGIHLRSEFPLPLPPQSGQPLGVIDLRSGPEDYFRDAVQGSLLEDRTVWHKLARLADGSSYMHWKDLGEFLVSSDGRQITCRKFPEAAMESFQVYLLGQALAFALVKQGFEPLHATTLEIKGRAVAFLGDSGFGKSSLAACFLEAGHTLVTDDMLILLETGDGHVAYPGPDRIKVFPGIARRFLGKRASGVPMNADTKKQVIPIGRSACFYPVPLASIYALCAPHEVRRKGVIRIEPLTPREAFISIVGNTFNSALSGADRLQRQAEAAIRLVRSVPVKKLFYPRVLSQLPAVRDAIVRDLGA